MKTITVCVGTSCHMKGSHHVIDHMGKLIEQHRLENEVELQAAFCMGRCGGNISAEIDGVIIEDLTEDNAEVVFTREILEKR